MTLTLYNTLTRRKETFTPLQAGKVHMYYCGVTVYDYCHLGHARACIVWDVVRRYLQWRGYQVKYIQNFTDIDDKILNRARQEGCSMQAVAERYIEAYFEDMDRLNIQRADAYPRATYTLDGIKRLVYELEQKGYAYPADGDVYYAVRQFNSYGKLSGRKLEDLQAGKSDRVNVEDPEYQKKKDPFDFALWKGAKTGEPAWESPWGAGRPGWHIECSAMVRDNLGETIDIHAGGADLIFPHHENEIAQSEAVTGKPLANYWMHNGMVTVDGEKMSKSLGNFITIRELLDRPTDPMAVRLFVLTAQYRKPIDFTDEAIAAATNGWHTLREGLLFGYQYGKQLGFEERESSLIEEVVQRFQEEVDDDFNFPGGLTVLFELAKELRREGNILVHQGKTETPPEQLEQQWHTLVTLAQVLGFEAEPEADTNATDGLGDTEIETLIQQRLAAKKAKNFGEADRIRQELQDQGITLIDQPGGVTRWHRN
ncbi:cysteine--tRNA ligase [Gloeocapsopsis dulcis]|uniref:Cysteine--tRNA ligase n=1 Tax=Gloeocapsopsis dulcis AAB1 = 1H9 TaxID=1433147 RepID=A0A6N8FT26_9CHRO|nr:cysteine--tRNA ligase [Gloeocapsopsis dulcis]MUL35904.1 cysteine--tRNA ligase [Gloeocapsopsis dulcis AAB1 = 1H9]WNN87628.1 cysteine--tRNA ligase [Gloeocapsopsis dulcis]